MAARSIWTHYPILFLSVVHVTESCIEYESQETQEQQVTSSPEVTQYRTFIWVNAIIPMVQRRSIVCVERQTFLRYLRRCEIENWTKVMRNPPSPIREVTKFGKCESGPVEGPV